MNSPRTRIPLFALLAAVLLTTLLPATAPAQEKPPGEIGLLLGVMRLDRDAVGPGEDPAYPALIGLRLGANMHRPVSYFLEGLYSSFEGDLLTDNSNVVEMRVGLERNFDSRDSDLGWYLAGAVGYADLNNPTGTDDFGRPLLSAGVGLRNAANHGVRWRLELREEVWMGDEGVNGFDIANTQVLLGLGLGLRARDGDPDDDGIASTGAPARRRAPGWMPPAVPRSGKRSSRRERSRSCSRA